MLKSLFSLLVLILLFNPFTLAWIASLYVVDDGLQHVDAVVALRGDPQEQQIRTEEAARLVEQNYAPILVLDVWEKPVFEKRQGQLEEEYFEKRGLPAPRMRLCENTADSTAEEAQVLRSCFQKMGIKEVVVVTSEYHTRRARLIFRKAFSNSGIVVRVHPVFDHDRWDVHWWRKRRWAKTFFDESVRMVWAAIEFSGTKPPDHGAFAIESRTAEALERSLAPHFYGPRTISR